MRHPRRIRGKRLSKGVENALREEMLAGDLAAGDTRRAAGAAIVAQVLAAHRSRSGSGGPARGGSGGSSRTGLLTDRELGQIEAEYPEGITSVQIVEVFTSRDVKFSEATFRKYVQQGLLPRSRRVGRKGKHRGSLGVYPAKTIRRINGIKQRMLDGYTIEEIQDQFLRFTDTVETIQEGLADLLARFEVEAESPRFDTRERKNLKREIADARRTADELLRRIEGLSQRVSRARGGSGAPASAEDLL